MVTRKSEPKYQGLALIFFISTHQKTVRYIVQFFDFVELKLLFQFNLTAGFFYPLF